MVEEIFALWNPEEEEYTSVMLIEDETGGRCLNFTMGSPAFTTEALDKAEILLGARGLQLHEPDSFIDPKGVIEVPVEPVP